MSQSEGEQLIFENETARILYHQIQQSESVGEGKVIIRGVPTPLAVYNVPTELLLYNSFNFRIRHQTDSLASSSDDALTQQWIEDTLKDSGESTNDALYNSVLQDGLKDPVIVRVSDAVVVDGNRRLMTFRSLVASGNEQYKTIPAMIIAEDLSDSEWLEIEARYQFEARTKSYYDSINEAKILRDLYVIHKDYEQVAQRVNAKKSHVQSRIATLDLIDNYLESIGETNNYSRKNIPSYALFEELVKEIDRRKSEMTASELSALETTGYNLITLRSVSDNAPEDTEEDEEFTLDDRTYRKLLKAFSLDAARQAMTDSVGSDSILSVEDITDLRDNFSKDVQQALVIQDADKQKKEPLRMISLAISHLKTVQDISDKRNDIVKALTEVTKELQRIRLLLQNEGN